MITPVALTPELLLAKLKANPHPKQTLLEMAGGFAYITINGHKIAYNGEKWFACGQQITPQFSMNNLHQEIDRVFVLAQKIKDHVLDKTTTSSWQEIKADCVGPDLPTEQTDPNDPQPKRSWVRMPDGMTGCDVLNPEQTIKLDNPLLVPIDRYRELEAELAKMTASRDEVQKKNDFINGQMSDLLAERERLFEKIKGLTEEGDRLKSKAGLLSVVCRRLCGDENATAETVHAAIDLCHDQANTIDFIGERVGSDPDTTIPNRFSEIRSLVAQAVKSLGEKTVEVEQSKKTISSVTDEMRRLRHEHDELRVGNKWKAETIEDLKRTTVKLPNEHTLRRLFNRHNAPDKYDDGTTIPTIERFLLIVEGLCRNADCTERRFEELNAISNRVNTESEDAHATLDEMGVPRWTTTNNYNERYLSLSARIRSVFQTHTKV